MTHLPQHQSDQAATNTDVAALKSDIAVIRSEMADFKTEIRADIKELKDIIRDRQKFFVGTVDGADSYLLASCRFDSLTI